MTDIDLPVRRSRPPRLYAALLAMIGLMLAGGGVWLALDGGSDAALSVLWSRARPTPCRPRGSPDERISSVSA